MEKKNKELLKLAKLLKHWADHNDSHKESLFKWKEIAKENGLENIVVHIEKAIEMLDESSKYLLKAQEELI